MVAQGTGRSLSSGRAARGPVGRYDKAAHRCGTIWLTDYSIAPMTRSGGRWPSAKVLMLMITRSPDAMRPSIVAEGPLPFPPPHAGEG
jgi:hypothetical protein